MKIKIVDRMSLRSGTQHDLAGTAAIAFQHGRQVLGDQMPKRFLAKRLGRDFLSGSVKGFQRDRYRRLLWPAPFLEVPPETLREDRRVPGESGLNQCPSAKHKRAHSTWSTKISGWPMAIADASSSTRPASQCCQPENGSVPNPPFSNGSCSKESPGGVGRDGSATFQKGSRPESRSRDCCKLRSCRS